MLATPATGALCCGPMMRLAYSALLIALLPAIILRMLLRSRRAPEYRRRLAERLGFFPGPTDARPLIWLHAVSLGEVLAAVPLLQRLLSDFPDCQLAVTTTTPTGSAELRKRFGQRVFHVYAPWDTPGAVQRCLDRLRPRALIIMETELWPNLLYYCDRRGCPVLLANARLSERSARGYRRLAPLSRQMFGQLRMIAAQDAQTARRFGELGMAAERLVVCGSIKFDLCIGEDLRERAAELRQRWLLGERPVVIAASTHEGEDSLVLEAFAAIRERWPRLLLILVPRHPERFDSVFVQCRNAGWEVLRRSAEAEPDNATDILLLDSIGELLLFFGLADIAVMGGSFVDRGGHNPLEPAAWGLPLVCGPSMFNFEQIVGQLRFAGALVQVDSASALTRCISEWLADESQRRKRGGAALSVVEENRGGLERLLELLPPLLGSPNGPDR